MSTAPTSTADGVAESLPGLSALWAETLGDPGVRVAVLDGPVDLTHPCFEGADLATIDTLVPRATGAGPASQHGTFVTSILFGRHGSPVAGVAPACKGLILPVFGEGPEGTLRTASQTDLGRAITQAVMAGAQIINLSGGELVDAAGLVGPLAEAMKLCDSEGVLLVAAAGNEGCRCIHVPAAARSALVVGASDREGAACRFSNFGDDYRDHGIVAPGEHVLGALPGGGAARRSGTSFSAPIVAGVAALLLSRERLLGRKTSPRQIFEVLLESAVTCEMRPAPDCARLMRGRLNVPGAVRALDARMNKAMVDASTTVQTAGTPHDEAVAPSGPAPEAVTSGATSDAAVKAYTERSPSAAEPAVTAASAPPPEAGAAAPSGIATSGCGCSPSAGSLVFVLGSLGFDFGTEVMRDALRQRSPSLYTNVDLASYLARDDFANMPDATAIHWTLSIDSYPVYVVRPSGAYADQAYRELQSFIADPAVERVSIPGRRTGDTVTLLSGQVVPVIEPNLQGMSSWSTDALVAAVMSEHRPPVGVSAVLLELALREYLARVYGEMRNAGASPPERALNFSATNTFAAYQVLGEAARQGYRLRDIEVEKSPICRPESDCWDVKLTFFDPLYPQRARQVSRMTVDVSDVEPVLIGNTRTWQVH